MFIKKNNLTIRNATASDAEQLCSWWNDGAIMAHAGFPNGVGTTAEEICKCLKNNNDEDRCCIIEFNGIAIGEMSYGKEGDKTVGIGIKICDFSKQNKGLGTTLLTMLIASLFSDYGYEKIILDTNLKKHTGTACV